MTEPRLIINEQTIAAPGPTFSDTVIGIVGTATSPGAGAPAEESISKLSQLSESEFGDDGSIPAALAGIFANVQDEVVVWRLPNAPTEQNVLDGLDAMASAENAVNAKPTLVVPLSHTYDVGGVPAVPTNVANDVVAKTLEIADVLDALGIVDFPWVPAASSAADLVTLATAWAANNYGSHLLGVGPRVVRGAVGVPLAPYIAAAIARRDSESQAGIAASPNGAPIRGITALEKNLTWSLLSSSLQVDELNSAGLVSAIQHSGWHMWGTRTMVDPTSTNPARFISVRRVIDDIRRHIIETSFAYFEHSADEFLIDLVVGATNRYLGRRVADRALTSGICVADPDRNTPSARAAGQVFFQVTIVPKFPAETIQFVVQTTSGI